MSRKDIQLLNWHLELMGQQRTLLKSIEVICQNVGIKSSIYISMLNKSYFTLNQVLDTFINSTRCNVWIIHIKMLPKSIPFQCHLLNKDIIQWNVGTCQWTKITTGVGEQQCFFLDMRQNMLWATDPVVWRHESCFNYL